MKPALAFCVCLFAFCGPLRAEEERFHGRYSRRDLEEGIVKYAKFRRVGNYIGLGGLSLFALGVVLAATADYPTDNDAAKDNPNPGVDPQAVVGIAAMPLGVGMAVTGLVFHIVGSKKIGDYEGMLEAISLRYRQNGGRRAIGLAYRF